MAVYQSPEEIERLVSAFEQCTLPGDEWTHTAHLTVALWYLTHYPLDEATERTRSGILAFNASRGIVMTETSGYHETITLFYIRVVGRYLRESDPNASLVELANGAIRDIGYKKMLTQYYSRQRQMSWEARLGWLEPDLRPLKK